MWTASFFIIAKLYLSAPAKTEGSCFSNIRFYSESDDFLYAKG